VFAIFLLQARVGLCVPLFTKERALQRERIHDVHLLENDHSGCGFFALFDVEPAVFETEEAISLAAQ
jgi:hypothetical protein